MVGADSLVAVEVVCVDVEGVGVPAAESLSNPGVVQTLSIAELQVAGPPANGCAQSNAAKAQEDAGVEGRGVQAGALSVVPVAEGGAGKGAAEPGGAAEDFVTLTDAEGHVEEVRVVLDQLDRADAEGQLFVCLGDRVGVRVLSTVAVVAIVTHIISY